MSLGTSLSGRHAMLNRLNGNRILEGPLKPTEDVAFDVAKTGVHSRFQRVNIKTQ